MHSIAKTNVAIAIQDFGPKGRGLCALERITEGTLIETLPVLVIDPPAYSKVRELPILNHTFVWDQHPAGDSGALGFGFASICNHSPHPNAAIKKDFTSNKIELFALKDIFPQEEITIKYTKALFRVYF